jgi:hypothetical protein
VAPKSCLLVGPLVEIDQQPHASSREHGQGSLRARVGTSEHAGRDPPSSIAQAQEREKGDPRLRQAAPASHRPLLSSIRPVGHLRTVPLGRVDGNREHPREPHRSGHGRRPEGVVRNEFSATTARTIRRAIFGQVCPLKTDIAEHLFHALLE